MIYTVGEMAQKLGVPASTLHYYDKEGLLPFVDLREVLQNGTAADLRDVMAQAILKKPMEHCFERPKDMTEHHLMSGIGG